MSFNRLVAAARRSVYSSTLSLGMGFSFMYFFMALIDVLAGKANRVYINVKKNIYY